ncbi:MAG: PepSY-associated TM helix domain-containing protein [Gemmataceae bacterium]|nr:PepSY domain-containing protein [Gemmata sp.]MDW8197775.1 PepSY-associated TM helix domain-containing protein [Gemmataceae bacterium]
MSNTPTTGPKPNPNARLLQFRMLHTWLGLLASVFIILIATTGIYLNHKDTFRPALELLGAPRKDGDKDAEKRNEHSSKEPKGKPSALARELATLPISLAAALETAAAQLNNPPIERVELKPEHGRVVYKIRTTGGPEVLVDAHTGHWELKGDKKEPKAHNDKAAQHAPGEKPPKPPGEQREKAWRGEEAVLQPDSLAAESRSAEPPKPKPMDWGKAIKDLHTGKIAGDAGKLLVDLVAVGLIGLTISGLYLWIIPALRKRRSAQQRAAAAAKASTVAN